MIKIIINALPIYHTSENKLTIQRGLTILSGGNGKSTTSKFFPDAAFVKFG